MFVQGIIIPTGELTRSSFAGYVTHLLSLSDPEGMYDGPMYQVYNSEGLIGIADEKFYNMVVEIGLYDDDDLNDYLEGKGF